MLNQKSKPTLYKAVVALNLPQDVRGQLRLRLDKELEVIEKHGLWNIFKRREDNLVGLDDVVANPELSIVGYLTQSLVVEHIAEQSAINGIEDFLGRMGEVAKRGGGALQEGQIIDLIAHRVFGPPQAAYKAYWAKVHPDEPCPKRAFRALSMFDARPVISIEKAKVLSGLSHVHRSIDFEDSGKVGHNMHFVGWADKPAVRIVKKNQKEMASFNLLPVDTAEDRIEVVCWPEHFKANKEVIGKMQSDELVSVLGVRAYNRTTKKKRLELTTIKILESPDDGEESQ